MEEIVDLPLDSTALMLLSEDPDEREFAIRVLGMRGQQLDLVETLAFQDEEPGIRMLAACWLAINGDLSWFDELSRLANFAAEEEERMLARQLERFALDYRMQKRAEEARAVKRLGKLRRLFGHA